MSTVKGSVYLQESGFCISLSRLSCCSVIWFDFLAQPWLRGISNGGLCGMSSLLATPGSVREHTSSLPSSFAEIVLLVWAGWGKWFPQTCSEWTYLFMRVSLSLGMDLVSFFPWFYKVLCSSKHQHWMALLEWTNILKPDNYYFLCMFKWTDRLWLFQYHGFHIRHLS